MLAGPQIMAAIIFVTAPKPLIVSAAFIAGVAVATTIGVIITIASLLIFMMPSDVIILLTVGVNLTQNDSGLLAALPFIGATVLAATLPLLFFLLFHRRAERLMPKVRDWMNSNSWVVNIIVCVVFIALIL
jgi:hypothetical protein